MCGDHGTGLLFCGTPTWVFVLGRLSRFAPKQNSEQMALSHGIIVESYLTDAGAFLKHRRLCNIFLNMIRRSVFLGTVAHDKNGIAERAVKTVSNMSRAMILHVSAHWKDGILDPSLWPMAVTFAAYL